MLRMIHWQIFFDEVRKFWTLEVILRIYQITFDATCHKKSFVISRTTPTQKSLHHDRWKPKVVGTGSNSIYFLVSKTCRLCKKIFASLSKISNIQVISDVCVIFSLCFAAAPLVSRSLQPFYLFFFLSSRGIYLRVDKPNILIFVFCWLFHHHMK